MQASVSWTWCELQPAASARRFVIPTVTSQSVLCSDSPIFPVVFCIHEIYIRRTKQWCLRLTVCHFHVQNLLLNYAKENTVFHSMAPLMEWSSLSRQQFWALNALLNVPIKPIKLSVCLVLGHQMHVWMYERPSYTQHFGHHRQVQYTEQNSKRTAYLENIFAHHNPVWNKVSLGITYTFDCSKWI